MKGNNDEDDQASSKFLKRMRPNNADDVRMRWNFKVFGTEFEREDKEADFGFDQRRQDGKVT